MNEEPKVTEKFDRPDAEKQLVTGTHMVTGARDLHGNIVKIQDLYTVPAIDDVVDIETYYFRH